MQIALLPVTTNPLHMLNMIMFPFKVKVLWCISRDVFCYTEMWSFYIYEMVH